MKIDIGEVITSSWQISWKNKTLWVLNVILMLFSFLFLPILLAPMIADVVLDQTLEDGLLALVFVGGSILFFLILYPAAALLNAALTLGILRAERGDEKLSLMDLVPAAYPFFWRYFGTMALFSGAMMLIIILFSLLTMLLSIVTFGLAMFCLMPFSFLQYPLMLVWYVCMEQALSAIVADDMNLMAAVKYSWQSFRQNILTFVIIGLVFYFGISMLSSVVIMPFMLPVFLVPFVLEAGETGRLLLILGGLVSLVFLPFFFLFQGGLMTLMKSGWVLTYLRVTRAPSASQPVLQEVPA